MELHIATQKPVMFTGFDLVGVATGCVWMAGFGFATGARDIFVHYAASKLVNLASYPVVAGALSPG
jgi:hypothetical protein